ncbi:hypothetical protein PRK78_003294 [Emydomyces testavorans]|uniref:Uncharacterized protein n=1 Tax=Emydomyces testavorans TaxID=2070801 RepID=A0AAF0DFX9_9EURO|nr:hypothetical protein PRK78_003294 [Emydomyces testavorans]
MANAIINTGVLVGTFWTLGELLGHKGPNPDKQTTVVLAVGNAPNAGGSVPHVALWDKYGNRIGQFKGDEDGHIDDSTIKTITINNDQNGGKPAQPEYISVVMHEKDAICLSAVIASGNGADWTWTGDLGYTCDAQWYPSQFPIGNSNNPPRCVWLDADHTHGIIAKGLSLHIRDFTGDPDLVEQYKQDQRRLCQNSARMIFQPEPILPDTVIPFFKPPLSYNKAEDGNSGGALASPDQGIDRKTRGYPDFTDMSIHDTKKRHARDAKVMGRNVQGMKNNRPGHLIISNMPGNSAKELCEHPRSLGADFVSTVEGTYCDMETGKWWYLCGQEYRQNCFDLEKQALRHGSTTTKRGQKEVANKKYKTCEEWAPKKQK